MRIVQVIDAVLPVRKYGGTERVVQSLARALVEAGHEVTLLAREGTRSRSAQVMVREPAKPLDEQLPDDIDVVHFHGEVSATSIPHLVTQHGNLQGVPHPQSVFVSRRHARNHGSERFVHNGLDWSLYPPVVLGEARSQCHFLGKAAWRVKNVRGAIRVSRLAGVRLVVLGGHRFGLKMGLRFHPDLHVRFRGMVDDHGKAEVLARSRGLIFPVTWHEPFGLAVVESLYYGSPVFGTPYGALPELVPPSLGVLSASSEALADGVRRWQSFDSEACHAHAREQFGARRMARDYLELYEEVAGGAILNPELPPVVDRFRGLPWS
jgi:glycosyltransferase involved in cell wall biosynthesis